MLRILDRFCSCPESQLFGVEGSIRLFRSATYLRKKFGCGEKLRGDPAKPSQKKAIPEVASAGRWEQSR
jgi:hypothetical protein